MRGTKFLIFGALIFFAGRLPGRTLADDWIQYRVTIPAGHRISSSHRTVLVVWDVDRDTGFEPGLYTDLVLLKLKRCGLRPVAYRGDFKRDFLRHRLSLRELVQDKLIISVRDFPSTKVSLSYLTAAPSTDTSAIDFTERGREAEKTDVQDGEKRTQIERAVHKALIRLTSKVVEVRREDREDDASIGYSSATQGTNADYEVTDLDSERRQGRLFLGGSLGTPALLNLNVGYWGGRNLPVMFQISGMYFSTSSRGIQGDVGWSFIDSGSVRQAIALSVSALNQSQSEEATSYDVLNRPLSVTSVMTNNLQPYLGPSYFVRWKSFVASIGAGAALSSDASSRFRALFQIGFVPEFRF